MEGVGGFPEQDDACCAQGSGGADDGADVFGVLKGDEEGAAGGPRGIGVEDGEFGNLDEQEGGVGAGVVEFAEERVGDA